MSLVLATKSAQGTVENEVEHGAPEAPRALTTGAEPIVLPGSVIVGEMIRDEAGDAPAN